MPHLLDPWKLIFGGLSLAAAAVAYLLVFAQEGDADWEAFKAAHHCQSVGAQAGNNQGGWRCDDGAVHYRWRQQK
jgi:hypothetical protein